MAVAGAFVKGRWLRQGRAPVAGPQTPGTWELGRTTTSGSPAARADFGVCRGRPRLGASAGLIRRTRACPLWRACGGRLLAGSRRTSVKARTAGGGPHPSRQRSATRGSLLPTRLRRRWRLGAVAKARADVGPRSSRGRIREGQPSRSAVARAHRLTAAQRDGVLPSSRRRRQTTSPRQASAKRLVR